MLVNKSIETPEGTIVFEGTLEKNELDLVLKLGLNLLYQMGALEVLNGNKDATIQ